MKTAIMMSVVSLIFSVSAQASMVEEKIDCKPIDRNGWFTAQVRSGNADSAGQLGDVIIEANGVYKAASLICQFDACGGIVNGAVPIVGKLLRDRNDNHKIVGLILKSANPIKHDAYSGHFTCR